MPNLYFDAVTIHHDGLSIPNGPRRSYAELKAASGTLRVFARRMTIEGVPDRSLNLGADRLTVTKADAFSKLTGPRTVRIAAERIEGPVRITCRGRTGAIGKRGTDGNDTKFIMVVADPRNPRVREPKLVSKPTAGTDGGPGGPGGKGGTIRLWYTFIQQSPVLAAPGGFGGPGGEGGEGGTGDDDLGIDDADDGDRGANGPVGPAGIAEAQPFSSVAALWHRWDREIAPDKVPFEWATYKLAVAEYHFRRGTTEDLKAARERLTELSTRDTGGAIPARVSVLLQRLFEHVTFVGLPRDLDVTPDVEFVSRDLDRLYDFAIETLRHGETIARFTEMDDNFAMLLRVGATHAANMLPAVEERLKQANCALDNAKSGTDIAKGRVANIDKKISEVRTLIGDADEAENGPMGMFNKIVNTGLAVGRTAFAVTTGVGAFAEVARGFATIQDVAAGSLPIGEVIDEVKAELNERGQNKLVENLDDVGKAGKSLFDLGKLTFELAGITAQHPDPRIQQVAELQREQLLLHKEVALHTQMEKEAQLGVGAATAEQTAINQNIAVSNKVATDLDNKVELDQATVLEPLIASARHILDVLGVHVFRTLRAREIYLALDPDAVVRHDIGHLHPDVERMHEVRDRVKLLRQQVESRFLQLVEWSSLVDQMADADNLSRGPITFGFTSTDASMLKTLRTTGKLGFTIPVEELFEEDGAQLFEAKFDAATITLHGAKFKDDTATILLRQLGRWAVRRRPDAVFPDGTVKEFVLPERHVSLDCFEVPVGVEARLRLASNPRAELPFSMWGRGAAGDYELVDDGDLDLSGLKKIVVAVHTQALSASSLGSSAANAQRQLRPLLAWPQPEPRPRPGIPVPPRGVRPYAYRHGVGSVAAVGAALI